MYSYIELDEILDGDDVKEEVDQEPMEGLAQGALEEALENEGSEVRCRCTCCCPNHYCVSVLFIIFYAGSITTFFLTGISIPYYSLFTGALQGLISFAMLLVLLVPGVAQFFLDGTYLRISLE